ncbi:gag-pol polyprotein [Tanacetum coccineum]
MSSFGVKEGKFLGHMVTEEGLRADPERIQAIILSPSPRSPYQIQSLFLQLTTINKFIPKLAELKHPLRKLQTLAIPKEGETLMLYLRQRMETISSALLIEREGIQIHVFYHKAKVVTDGPIEEILKLFGKEGQLGKWAAEIRTYDISYILRKEAKGLVMKKFFGHGEHVEGTPDANAGGTFTLSEKLQAKSTPTPRAWQLYVGKETIEEGSSIGIILVIPKEKMHSYAIRLKFHASNHVMDYEALLAGLAASTNQGMKDLHVFIDSLTLVARVEGSHTPVMKQERKYKEEILDVTVLFHRFRITHLPKILNFKAEVLTGLATIKLEFLNYKVSVGIKTRPSAEETSRSKKEKQQAMRQGQNQITIVKLVGVTE